jgi:hypothetical protein
MLHKGERGLGGLQVGDHFLPGLHEGLVRVWSHREIGGEVSSPGPGGGEKGSGQEAGSSAEHGGLGGSLGSRSVGEKGFGCCYGVPCALWKWGTGWIGWLGFVVVGSWAVWQLQISRCWPFCVGGV